jgi:CO/xanthine dehydrogenase FAD-binding subunit
VLVGERPDGRPLDDAIEKLAAATDPPSDIHASAAFRKKLARHVGRQAIELAVRRAGGAS